METAEEVKNTAETSNNFVLTPEMAKPLKCSFCNLYLSYPPVYMTTQDDVRYKCGRCIVKTRFNFRDVMYEDLAKNMKFPCIYKDCKEALAWNDVRDHETNCEYRTLPCIASNCQEAVLESNFASHFKEKHKNLYHSNKIVLDTLHSSGGVCVLEKDGKCYVFFYDTNIDKLRMCLTGIDGIDKQFELIFKSKDSKNSIVITEHNIIQYNSRVHCYKCLKGECKLAYHLYCTYRKGLLKYANGQINKDILKRTFGNEYSCVVNVVDEKMEAENDDELDELLMGKDVVIDEVTEDDDEAEAEKQSHPIKTDVIKEQLNCPGCNQQLSAPIFQCLSGHVVCKECKTKAEDSKCLTCESKIENTRNYIIEEAITNLKLCPIINDVEEKEIMCPTSKCQEMLKPSAISTHFKESHLENFHFNKVILKNIYGYYNVDVLVKNEKTYLLFFDFDDFNFGISVCTLEAEDETYEIKLLSDNKKAYIIASDQKVVKFNHKEHCFKCSIGTCGNTDHTFKHKHKEVFRHLTTKINRDCVKKAFKSSTFSYQIQISEPKTNKTDKIIRQLFECFICKDYMVPPIYQCVAGHSLCNDCKSKVEKCPSCESKIEETRNIILENISETVELPCSFESKNCTFRAGVKRVASHEQECPLNTKKQRMENSKETTTNGDGATVKTEDTKDTGTSIPPEEGVNSNETVKEEAMETTTDQTGENKNESADVKVEEAI
ncbi:uncharacterized protein LOC130893534 isoform X1 [Diorhabda carinulata]|uniref:uncharacterized protein LOC130893534 isoform X1 n=1 Tax=Diorhabda carinulata TaxID=1163345 RepID=UPI0025A250F5|nr:uncharacterized protein LOC130893534 isoform X1 [Diorhabda carinulata]